MAEATRLVDAAELVIQLMVNLHDGQFVSNNVSYGTSSGTFSFPERYPSSAVAFSFKVSLYFFTLASALELS